MKLLMIFMFFSTVGYMAEASLCGRISSMRGQIEVLRLKEDSVAASNKARTGIMAKNKMKLWCSDIVLTRRAARAKIQLRNNTVMTLGPLSRIEIENYMHKSKSVNQLKLTYGKVRALFKSDKKVMPTRLPEKGEKASNSKTSSLYIKTPSAVAGVRGTDFYVSYNPEKEITEQATISGEVEVKNEVTGQKVSVKPGNQVQIEKIDDKIADKIKDGLKEGKPLSLLQEELGVVAEIAPPKPIANSVKLDIRQTSAIVRNDKAFVTKEAVAILGTSKEWKVPSDEMPLEYKDLKEEF